MTENQLPIAAYQLPRLATRVFGTPLLIQPEKLEIILASVGHRFIVEGVAPAPQPEAASSGGRLERKPYAVTEDGIAVIEVAGSLVNRSSWMDAYSGMTSYSQLSEEIEDAMTDPAIKGAVLRIDSCGGECAGCYDLADSIYKMRGMKPIWASVDDSAFSAAYMIASAADKVFVSRTGGVGSIGVIATHVDVSAWDAKAGVKYTMLTAGAHKKDFNSHEPLSNEARTELQGEIDRLYGLFVENVARNRGLTANSVRATEAKLFFGDRGMASGLADEVLSFGEVVSKMSSTLGPKQSSIRMEAPLPAREADGVLAPVEAEVEAFAPAATSETPVDIEIPAPEGPDDMEDTTMNETQTNGTTQTTGGTIPATVVATTDDIMDLCQLAGFGLDVASGMRGKGLTVAQVRQELLAKKADESVKGVSSVVAPVSTGQVDQLEAAAKASAASAGVPWQQVFAANLKSNPAAYDQYLAANPAQTSPSR